MRKRQNHLKPKGNLNRVAPGLYRSTASAVYFAHVRINGKLFRDSLETTDRKTADRKLRDFRHSKAKIDFRLGKVTLADLWRSVLGHARTSLAEFAQGESRNPLPT